MDEETLKVGDRVTLVKDVSHYHAGRAGTVVGVGVPPGPYIEVAFDEQPEGVQYVSCEPAELAKVAVKIEDVDAIRDSWIRWLKNASDEAVLRFHQKITDLLDEDDEGGESDLPRITPSA